MDVRTLLFGKTEKRESGYHPSKDPPTWIKDQFSLSTSGVSVTPETAESVPAVYACVRVISESIAQLPLIIYKRLPNGGKQRATNLPLYSLLSRVPNPYMTRFEWIEMMITHILLRGNSFSQVIYDKAGRTKEIFPLNPTRCKPIYKDSGDVTYQYTQEDGRIRIFQSDEVLHTKGPTKDGINGQSPISIVREAIGLAIAAEQHGSATFMNGAGIQGVLHMESNFGEGDEAKEAINRLKEDFKNTYTGRENYGKVAILEDGLKFEKIGMSLEDAQFLDTRRFQKEEIASIFRVPPHMIQDLTRATFSNIEHQALGFVQHTLMPWMVRLELAIHKTFFGSSDDYIVEFLVDGLLRGDFKTRQEGYALAIQNSTMTPNEVRIMENRNPDDRLDVFFAPLNMSIIDEHGNIKPNIKEEPKQISSSTEDKGSSDEDKRSLLRPIFEQICERVARKEEKFIEHKIKTKEFDKLRSFYDEFPNKIVDEFIPSLEVYTEGKVEQLRSKVLEWAKYYAERRFDNLSNASDIEVVFEHTKENLKNLWLDNLLERIKV